MTGGAHAAPGGVPASNGGGPAAPREERLRVFLERPPFAVVGASNDLEKYGGRVLAAYREQGLLVYPVNPRSERVQGLRSYPSLAALPEPVRSVSVVTPPSVTERIVEEAASLGGATLWLQPGAESAAVVARAAALGVDLIHGGPCVLVALSLLQPGRPSAPS